MNQQHYLIKDLAKKTQVSTDAIRFYEKKNLIQPSFRAENNYRYYNEDALKRLILIKRCRSLDMTLKEIETLIELEKHPQQDCCSVNNVIDEHLNHIEQKIEELQNFQIQLKQLRQTCSTQNTIDQCQILKQLESDLTN
ncbi:MerR family DNA-binding protein [Acinetobacter shaoyimingii]|uniref:MerR family transcriptional regulator n=1 Tax=Acinetobacter shaoyimingii TaxID=2715164 RepID=A0A6G8RU18_9GAMM|nr:MerR family DNA-binding protein [Acinetobacter shaoyimingii]NHB58323.1 MerR family transcriptional regulator [Acinetobacter shaoyimingii]QIO05459.1 MerR family transcriptional regulator [Acinetobacter shaoyimingii]